MHRQKFWFTAEDTGRSSIEEIDTPTALMEHLEALRAEWDEPVTACVLVPVARASVVGVSLNQALLMGRGTIREFLGIAPLPPIPAPVPTPAPESEHTEPERGESVYNSIRPAEKRCMKTENVLQLEIGGY